MPTWHEKHAATRTACQRMTADTASTPGSGPLVTAGDRVGGDGS